MLILIAGLVLFLGAHSVAIVAPYWRDRMALLMGQIQWKGLYAVISILGFVAIIWGYGIARHSPLILYAPPFWLRYVTFFLMLPVFPLALAAYLPGEIKTATRHPLLAATKFWAAAHLLSNGSLAAVILFGSFLAWAVVDRISLKQRVQAPIQTLPASPFNDTIAVIGGLTLYILFVWRLHLWLIGVRPIL
jgi:uncharacterized membrane protein